MGSAGLKTPFEVARLRTSPSSRDLQVGRIPFLVCAPFFHDSLSGLPGIVFRDGPPSWQNAALRRGDVDLSPTSSFEYACRPEDYEILPGLCTAGRLEIRSVRLFSRWPWPELAGRPVRLSRASATSNALFQILSSNRYGIETLILPAETPAAGDLAGQVAIGDEALALAHAGDWPHSYDLAVEWQAWQNLPFAFGLWLLRREAAQEKSALVSQYLEHLHRSVADFREHPQQALKHWLAAYPAQLPLPEILAYYAAADYAFTSEHAESLKRFFTLAHAQGLVQQIPELRFFSVQ